MVRRLRKARGYRRQSDLGALIGVTGATISTWETGTHPPTQEHARALDDVLRAGGEILNAYGYHAGPATTTELANELLARLRQFEERLGRLEDAARLVPPDEP